MSKGIIFTIFILIFSLTGCSTNSLLDRQPEKKFKITENQNTIRPNLKVKIDNLRDYKITEIKHLTKGIEELKLYEPEYPKEFKAGKFKILLQKGNNKKTIICQTEALVGHLGPVIPGKTVIDGYILIFDGDNKGDTINKNNLLTKAEEKYLIEQIYKRFSQKMTKEQATKYNTLKDFALAIYFNGDKGIDEFHTQHLKLTKNL